MLLVIFLLYITIFVFMLSGYHSAISLFMFAMGLVSEINLMISKWLSNRKGNMRLRGEKSKYTRQCAARWIAAYLRGGKIASFITKLI